MQLKKIIIAAILLISISAANAQSSFGFHAAGIMTTLKDESEEEEVEFKYRPSFKLGAFMLMPLTETISFMPQLNVVSKGAKIDQSGTEDFGGEPISYKIKGNVKMTYLELPLNFLYNSRNEAGGVFFALAPSISFGLDGEIDADATFTYQGETLTESVRANVEFDGEADAEDDDAHFKRIDFGVQATLGFRITDKIFINAIYNHGISNINPDEGSKTRTRYFGIGGGYILNFTK